MIDFLIPMALIALVPFIARLLTIIYINRL